MKKILQLIRPFRETRNIVALCLAFFLCAGSLWAQTTHTIGWGTASGDAGTYTNFTAVSGSVSGVCTFEAAKNDASSAPAYNANSSELRLYYAGSGKGGSIIITPAAGVTITGAVVTTSTTPSVVYYIDEGDPISVSVSENTYTISDISATNSLEIQNANTTNTQLRIKTIALTYTISGTPPATYTVTFDAGDGTFVGNNHFPNTSNTKTAGTYTLPSAERSGYTFDGWMITGDSQLYTDSYTVSDDVDFTAQYTENTPLPEGTDVLDWAATGSPTNYTDWTYTAPSGAVYKGQSSGTYQSIQLRSNNNNSGIVTTTSAGVVSNVTVVWNDNTASGRTLNVYGKHSAYTAATDLYGNDAGTLIGTIVNGTSTSLDITEDYEYIGLRSSNSAMYLNEIQITWESVSPAAVATPTFTPASGTEFGNDGLNVTLSCATDGTTIYYTLDGSEPDDESLTYTEPIHISSTTTINAIAYLNGDASNVATATYTYIDPNTPGTENNPYTVAQARAAIDANSGTQGVYATGIVSAIPTAYSTQYSNITFNIVDEEGDEDFLQAFRCAGAEAANVAVGDIVVVYGNLTKYNNTTYEFGQGCQLVSLTHPTGFVAAPTFSPEAGMYSEPQTVTLACMTPGASIYYTLDGSEPDNESLPYTQPITVSTTTTINAIAYVGGNASTVATATYSFVSLANISDITEVGAAYEVQGTVVATNSRGFIMGDGTGYVYYYNNGAVSQSIGDMVTVSGITGTYGHIIQFTNTATVSAATSSNYNGTPAATLITEVPDYSQGYHISDYFEFEGVLTKNSNNYFIAVGEDTIQISYPTSAQGTTLTALDGVTVHAKGYFAGINSNGRFTTMLESVEEVAGEEPSIVVTPAEVNVPYTGAEGVLTLTSNNVELDLGVEVLWYDAEGSLVVEGYDWISAEISADMNQVEYVVEANEGEARTAYMKVYAMDAELNDVYSDLVTISQEAYVAPVLDYATLPFEFDGGRADIATTDGLTQEGLESDYSSSPKLKFKTTGTWVLLHFNEEPGMLTFDIKGNSFSEGTFTVQTSEDGETYTDLATYTELGAMQSETFNTLGADVRYIKWVYTNKVDGNVALGNIVLRAASDVPEQYDLTVSEFENLEIFTFVDDLNELALEGAGTIQVNENANVSLSVSANEGYIIGSLVVDGENVTSQIDETGMYTFVMPSHSVTITATAIENVPGNWVLTDIADLTENDVFVIVETKDGVSHAMANNNGSSSAPAAVEVVVVGNTLSGEPADSLQWNISGNANDGYTFYPNGDTESWLYCTNTNNGLRVGDNEANTFSIDAASGYLVHAGTGRYIGVYLTNPDWRSYTTINTNIAEQTFAFYKKVTTSTTQTTALSSGANWFSSYVEITLDDLKAALVATGNTEITIQGQTQNTIYNPNNGRWTGQLRTLDLS
nr:chitobiase/beta-hexosaminidase C-terminal domain-containing protein [Bacteroidales bacterium]